MPPGTGNLLTAGFANFRDRGNGAFILIIVLLPWLLLIADIGWPFNLLGQADAYYFSGFLRDYPLLAANAPSRNLAYETSRLPWILPGYGLYRIFGPQTANMALKSLVFYATVFAFYFVASRCFGYLFAFVGTVLLCTDGVFLRWIGSDYVSGSVVCYSLVSLAFFTQYWLAVKKNIYLALGGFFAACAVLDHLFAATLILIIAMFHCLQALRDRDAGRHDLAGVSTYPVVGAIVALLVFGFANVALGREFLFFVPQLRAVAPKSALLDTWRQQGHEWISYADWLILPIFVFVYSAGVLAGKNALRRFEMQRYVFSLLSVVLFVMYFGGNLLGLYFFVERDYYMVFGIGIFYLAITEQLHAYAEGKSILSELIVLAAGLVAVQVLFRLGPLRDNIPIAGTSFPVKRAVAILVLMSVLAWRINPKYLGPSLVTMLLLLARANIWMPESFSTSYVTSAAINSIYHRIRQALNYTLPVIWYDVSPDSDGGILPSLSSMFLQPTGHGFSNPAYRSGIRDGAVVVLLSHSDAGLAAGAGQLRQFDAKMVPWDRFDESTPAGDIKGWILKALSRVIAVPPSGFTPAAPGAAVVPRSSGVTIRTPDVRWFFGGDLPIPPALLQDSADAGAQVHLRINVRAGPVGVGVLKRNRTWIAQQALSAAGPADVYLAIPRLGDATDIIVYNGGVHAAGLVDVDAVSIATFK